ncbi:MAG: triose-phosphate isomerase [Bacillota bacterium]
MELIIAANWKMQKTAAEAVDFCERIKVVQSCFSGVEVLICPPFTALPAAGKALQGSAVKLGAQNMFWEEKGAYTGEVAPLMLKEFGTAYVIIGHSERRHILCEDDGAVRKKLEAALRNQLIPILCVGETEAQRNRGETASVLERQVGTALDGLDPGPATNLVVAYEPVWAIGTGRAASPADASAAACVIKATAARCLGSQFAIDLRIQYGGSVKADNIGDFVALPEIHGALVGGASLEADSFINLITAAKEAAC